MTRDRRLSPLVSALTASHLALVANLVFPLSALAQEIRLGTELQVNTYTTGFQRNPSVAARADGGFVVVWSSNGQDGALEGVFGRRFSSAGSALAVELQVSAYTTNEQRSPSVAADADGDFVVAWQSLTQDGGGYGIFARRFSSTGGALAVELQVNAYTSFDQEQAAVVVDADGDFVIAWASDTQDSSNRGVFVRRFSKTGTPLASELQVNTYTTNNQEQPAMALDADGDLVVVWQSYGQDPSRWGVFARRFSSAGAPLASELQVNLYTEEYQNTPSVAASASGDFVVVWQSFLQDGEDYGVFARRFSSAGAPLTGELQVNIYTTSFQYRPSVVADADGDFVVTWGSYGQDGAALSTVARRFSSAGAALASEFQVNTYTPNDQYRPSVAADAHGRFVIAWQDSARDGSNAGVFAQRFVTPISLDIDGNGSVAPLTDGILALRYLFGFRGATLTNGAIDLAGCTRCNASPIEAYLETIALPSPLAQEVRVGSELQINSFTANVQSSPSLAAEADGDFVVAWQSAFQDGSFNGVFARRFTSAGAPLASEFQANGSTAFNQTRPSVAADANGDFVVAWESDQAFARRFSSTGISLAGEFQVNNFTAPVEAAPFVAVSASGDFVVAWESYPDGGGYGIRARRFSSTGVALASELLVNTHVTGDQRNPAVAAEADGDFVIAWSSSGQDGSANAVIARRFSSSGAALATEFQVNTYVTSSQYRPSVAADADGDLVIAWESAFQDGSSNGIFARRFSSIGTSLASEFQVNSYTTDFQTEASAATDADGDFVIAWNSSQDGDPPGAFARRFASSGAALAAEFQVSARTTGGQSYPSVALDAHGRFVVAWQDSARDGSSDGVFAQRFLGSAAPLDIDGNGSAEPLTDGLLVLRYLFGFRAATLINGVVGAGCSRCDAPLIEAYLAGLT